MKFLNGWTKKSVIRKLEDTFKGKAMDKHSTRCVYKTSDGKKCAVGIFIDNKHKANNFMGSVHGLLYEYPSLEKVLPLDLYHLEVLQTIHDKGASTSLVGDDRTDEEILMDLISFIESET